MVVTELTRILDSVSKDKGVKKEVIISAIEEAVLLAAERLFRSDGKFTELEVHFNEDDGEVELFEFKKVVNEVSDGDVEIAISEAVNLDPEAEIEDFIGVKISPDFTRIAIQNAKQKILQKLKEAEGKVIYEEFKTRKGELVGGIVRRIERRTAIVDLGRTEAILPPEHHPSPVARSDRECHANNYARNLLDPDRLLIVGPALVVSPSDRGNRWKAEGI